MKLKSTVTALILAVVLQGCGLFSIHALYTKDELLKNDQILGTWESEGDELIISSLPDNLYLMTITSDDTIRFVLGLIELNGQLYADLFPYSDCEGLFGGDCIVLDNMGKNFIPVHSFMKIDISPDKLTMTSFDQERLQHLFAQNRIRLSHEKVLAEPDDDEPIIVLTASTEDLQKFVARYGNEEDAYDDPTNYSKLHSK